MWRGKGSRTGCCVEWLSHRLPKNKSTILGPQSLFCQVDYFYSLWFCVYFSFCFLYYLTNPVWNFWLGSVALSGIKRNTWIYRVVKGGVPLRGQCDVARRSRVGDCQEDQTQRNRVILLGKLLIPTRKVFFPVPILEGFRQRWLHHLWGPGHNESVGPQLGVGKSVSFSYKPAPAQFTADGVLCQASLDTWMGFRKRSNGVIHWTHWHPVCSGVHTWPGPIREQGGPLEEGDVASSSQFKLCPREKQQQW